MPCYDYNFLENIYPCFTGLLKGQNMTMHYQLYLSMVWDRVDIAEEKIFVHGSECLGKHTITSIE